MDCLKSEDTDVGLKLLPADGAAGDFFGFTISVSNDFALVGAHLNGDQGMFSGSSYMFERHSTDWSQAAKLLPSDGAFFAAFGISAALDGDTAVIGANRVYTQGQGSGAAYMFERVSDKWTQRAKLLPADGSAGAEFGLSSVVSGDIVVVAAPKKQDPSIDLGGSVYVFTSRNSSHSQWTQHSKLLPSDGDVMKRFGNSVSASNSVILIGSYWDSQRVEEAGAAYVFVQETSLWTEKAKLMAKDAQKFDYFGHQVSISNRTAVIGAHGDDSFGPFSGSAYVFETIDNSMWTQIAKLTPSNPRKDNYFGWSVSVIASHSQTDRILVGAWGPVQKSDNDYSAYLYERVADASSSVGWSQRAKLTPADGVAQDFFGFSVSLNTEMALVGAYYSDDLGRESGSVYLFNTSSKLLGRSAASHSHSPQPFLRSPAAIGMWVAIAVVVLCCAIAVVWKYFTPYVCLSPSGRERYQLRTIPKDDSDEGGNLHFR